MDTEFSQTVPTRPWMTLTARIMKMPEGWHAVELGCTTPDTGEAILWSRIFRTESKATIKAALVRQWDHFMAEFNGENPGPRPKD
jgi:hypothetical protein